MAVVLSIIPAEPIQRFSAVLNGTTYGFRVRWNDRESRWYMDVYEADGTPIKVGIAIVLGAYLGRGSTHDLFMSGIFVARDTTRQLAEAGFDDLGTRVEVWYFTRDEAAQTIMAEITERAR